MSEKHKALIESLVADAGSSSTNKPPRLLPVNLASLLYVVLSCVAVAGIMYVLQPFRSGIWQQFLNYPVFALELISGFAALLMLGFAMLRSSVPGSHLYALPIGLGLLAIWLASILSGYFEPALPPSMAGKREECYFEALYYSAALALVAIYLLRVRYALRPGVTAAVGALLVPSISAYLMQIACMHDVGHSMTHHLLPAFVSAVVLFPVFLLLVKPKDKPQES